MDDKQSTVSALVPATGHSTRPPTTALPPSPPVSLPSSGDSTPPSALSSPESASAAASVVPGSHEEVNGSPSHAASTISFARSLDSIFARHDQDTVKPARQWPTSRTEKPEVLWTPTRKTPPPAFLTPMTPTATPITKKTFKEHYACTLESALTPYQRNCQENLVIVETELKPAPRVLILVLEDGEKDSETEGASYEEADRGEGMIVIRQVGPKSQTVVERVENDEEHEQNHWRDIEGKTMNPTINSKTVDSLVSLDSSLRTNQFRVPTAAPFSIHRDSDKIKLKDKERAIVDTEVEIARALAGDFDADHDDESFQDMSASFSTTMSAKSEALSMLPPSHHPNQKPSTTSAPSVGSTTELHLPPLHTAETLSASEHLRRAAILESCASKAGEHRVFVGNVPKDVGEAKLRDFFSQLLPVRTIFVGRDVGQHLGWAVAGFANAVDAAAAARSFDGVDLDGNRVRVSVAKPKPISAPEPVPVTRPLRPPRLSGAEAREVIEYGTNVYLKNLPECADEKHYAFCAFTTASSALSCIAALDGLRVDGRMIRASVAHKSPRKGKWKGVVGGLPPKPEVGVGVGVGAGQAGSWSVVGKETPEEGTEKIQKTGDRRTGDSDGDDKENVPPTGPGAGSGRVPLSLASPSPHTPDSSLSRGAGTVGPTDVHRDGDGYRTQRRGIPASTTPAAPAPARPSSDGPLLVRGGLKVYKALNEVWKPRAE
ncbi:hypothetical protein HDU93_001522 [Gonapodya sp. JEL0774]|nr:hypothetical protein HDU93_001522 [Gonapodya sp. JEL0774]